MTASLHRSAGIAGILAVLLTLVISFVPHEALPEQAPPAQEVTTFFEANAAMQAAQPFFKALGAMALLVFAVLLAEHIRAHGAPVAATLTLAGGILFATVVIAAMILVAAIVTLASEFDGAMVFALYNAAWIMNVRAGLAAVPFVGAAAIGILRTRALPRWTGYLGIVAVAVSLGGGAAALAMPGPEGIGPAFIGFVFVLLWTLATSVALLVRGAPGAAEPRARPMARAP